MCATPVHMNIAALTVKYHPMSFATYNINAVIVLLVGEIYRFYKCTISLKWLHSCYFN